MAGDLKRRVGALEGGNGTIGIGDLLDHIDDATVSWSDPRTWPLAWRGKVFDQRVLRGLDALPPGLDQLTTEEMKARLAPNEVPEIVKKSGL